MQFRLDAVLPVPDGGLGDADDLGDLPLEETEIHASPADVLADRERMFGVTGNWLFLQGNSY